MTLISSEPPLFERRLAEAARAFSRRVLGPRHEDEDERTLEAMLLRFGFAPSDIRSISVKTDPLRLGAMEKALAREFDHHRRVARGGRLCYDLNRHIAVARAIRRLASRTDRAPVRP